MAIQPQLRTYASHCLQIKIFFVLGRQFCSVVISVLSGAFFSVRENLNHKRN